MINPIFLPLLCLIWKIRICQKPSRHAHQVGFAFGLITAFSNLGTVFGPAAAGLVRDMTGGWSLTWLLLAAVPVIGVACSLLLGRRLPGSHGSDGA